MPKLRPETESARATKLAKALLANDLNCAAVGRQLGRTRQAIGEQARRKPVQERIQKYLNTPKFAKKWREQGNAGAFEAERSISAAILVQKDGTLVKADDEGGITMPDHAVRHKYWRDLGLAAGFLVDKPVEVNVYTQIWNGVIEKSKRIDSNGRVIAG